ncbi:hypothetical protein NHQ30_003575 [Ciborinia camelliae]|nr:hypothetical protein NHQ30_003575 [Ciborinia camelliae]
MGSSNYAAPHHQTKERRRGSLLPNDCGIWDKYSGILCEFEAELITLYICHDFNIPQLAADLVPIHPRRLSPLLWNPLVAYNIRLHPLLIRIQFRGVKIRILHPFMIAGSVLMSIGYALTTLRKVDESTANWIGIQVLIGCGSGFGLTQDHMAAQTLPNTDDIPNSTSVLLFAQMFGGAVFLGVTQNVFDIRLVARLTATLSGAPVNTETFNIPTALCTISVVGALVVKWKSVKAWVPILYRIGICYAP